MAASRSPTPNVGTLQATGIKDEEYRIPPKATQKIAAMEEKMMRSGLSTPYLGCFRTFIPNWGKGRFSEINLDDGIAKPPLIAAPDTQRSCQGVLMLESDHRTMN
jgi:hypothetical protein